MAIPPSSASRLWRWGAVGAQMTIIVSASSVPDLGALPGGTPDRAGHGVGGALVESARFDGPVVSELRRESEGLP